MEEWTVVTSLAVVAGLVASVAGPVVRLNGTISRLSAILEHVLARLDKLERTEEQLHARDEEIQRQLTGSMDSQGSRLSRCENRLSRLEWKEGARDGKDQLESAD